VELTKGKYNRVNFNLSPKKYSLRIDTANSAQGTTDPAPGLYEYDYGTKVTCHRPAEFGLQVQALAGGHHLLLNG
jgi:hypothetical protein